MSDQAPKPHVELVAVFGRKDQAEEARRQLRAIGLEAGQIELDRQSDEVLSLKGEMREELTEGWILPQAALALTKEGAKGFTMVTLGASIIGAIVAAPFAFVDFGLTFLGRLVLLVLVGFAFGGSIGLVLGPALAVKRPEEAMAAQRGVVLRVRSDSDRIREVLAGLHPIRVDEVKGGVPIGTVTTEEAQTPTGTVQDIEAGARGDDFRAGQSGTNGVAGEERG